MMRSQIPSFRLPIEVLEEEVDRILDMGVVTHFDHEITSMKSFLEEDFDAVFVGTGAPRGRDLELPGRAETDAHISIGIDWLSSVAFGHTTKIEGKVIVMGGGNTAMDCCRTAKRMGAEIGHGGGALGVRGDESLGVGKRRCHGRRYPIINNRPPKEFVHENGKLKGVIFECVKPVEEDGRSEVRAER